MEPEQNQPIEQEQEVSEPSFREQESSSGVSFPTVGEQKKSGGAKTLLIVGILVLVAILGFVIYKSASKKSADASLEASPFDSLTTPSSEQVVESVTPAPSPAVAAVDKTKVKVQVQNGTGITGEAAYLQTQLGGMGYTDVKVGNSSSTVTATTVTFSSKLDSSVVSEITQKLNLIYQTVTSSTSSSSTFDVVVVIGLRKGATPKPSTAPTTVPSASPTATATPTATP
jgi:hypothetical protein